MSGQNEKLTLLPGRLLHEDKLVIVKEGYEDRYCREWGAQRVWAGAPGVAPVTTTVDMLLLCPRCGVPHIDVPDPEFEYYGDHVREIAPENRWTNPPHRSHRCRTCGTIWRPADVPTNGVAFIATRGKADNWPPVESAPQ